MPQPRARTTSDHCRGGGGVAATAPGVRNARGERQTRGAGRQHSDDDNSGGSCRHVVLQQKTRAWQDKTHQRQPDRCRPVAAIPCADAGFRLNRNMQRAQSVSQGDQQEARVGRTESVASVVKTVVTPLLNLAVR